VHAQRKELQDTQIDKTMQQNAALTWLDGAPATMAWQPCLSVQLCIQGLGDAACSSAGVLILVLHYMRGTASRWGNVIIVHMACKCLLNTTPPSCDYNMQINVPHSSNTLLATHTTTLLSSPLTTCQHLLRVIAIKQQSTTGR
jgi:hypothetical protein